MKPNKSAEAAPPRLGRGLAALLGGAETLTAATRMRGQQKIPIEFLRSNPRNPRRNFGEDGLDELAASIKEKGIIQPLLARPLAGTADAYEIIAAGRRADTLQSCRGLSLYEHMILAAANMCFRGGSIMSA